VPRIQVDVATSAHERDLAMRVWRAANHARRRPAGEVRAGRVRARLDSAELLLLAHYGTRPAGMLVAEQFVDGEPFPGAGHISMVYVDPAVWGSGIGGRLLREVQGRSWDRLSAWTGTENRRAVRLFLSAGFEDTGNRSQLQDGDEIMRFAWERSAAED
jgi:ribosomal protein S18 acetylase RimI-like enzyme